MSFRLFVYYCAVCGAWAALAGWLLGRLPAGLPALAQQALKGLCLGLAVGGVLALVDALWNFSLRRPLQVAPRVLAGLFVGSAGGLVGGAVGQAFYGLFGGAGFQVAGWALAGLLIGASVGVFDLLAGCVRPDGARGALRKLLHAALGGGLGGVAGASLLLIVGRALEGLFPAKEGALRSPGAVGFITLGACIGLLVGLAQVLLKDAWVRVEEGFRAGRALILTRPEITLGRAESCDLGLFGDPGVERLHARIRLEGGRYVLHDAGGPGGTFVNEQRVAGPVALRSGDLIRMGRSVLRFEERHRQSA